MNNYLDENTGLIVHPAVLAFLKKVKTRNENDVKIAHAGITFYIMNKLGEEFGKNPLFSDLDTTDKDYAKIVLEKIKNNPEIQAEVKNFFDNKLETVLNELLKLE